MGLTARVGSIRHPTRGVVTNVSANTLQVSIIPDDMIVVTRLPDLTFEGHQGASTNPPDVVRGRHALEVLNHMRQEHCLLNFPSKQPMQMIWHDDVLIQHKPWKLLRQTLPNLFHHSSCDVQTHLPLTHLAKQPLAILRTQRNVVYTFEDQVTAFGVTRSLPMSIPHSSPPCCSNLGFRAHRRDVA